MVKRKLDKVLIVDVEATCWENGIPEGQENEIIEIGLCLLDVASWQPQDKRSIIIRPEHSTVSPFCTQLTGITQEQADQGISSPRRAHCSRPSMVHRSGSGPAMERQIACILNGNVVLGKSLIPLRPGMSISKCCLPFGMDCQKRWGCPRPCASQVCPLREHITMEMTMPGISRRSLAL